ncbi:MAG: N4-gp56 family major capsid protein [Mycobacteriaceae bacterium]
MVDVFTSIATTPGYGDNTVKAAYDLLFKWALNSQVQYRNFVDVRPQSPSMSGSSITLQLNQYFDDPTVNAAKTPLTEEADVSAVKLPATKTVTLTPQEYGFANLRTLKLANRAMTPVDPVIAIAVADHMRKVVDELIQDKLASGVASGNQLFAGSATAINQVTAAMTPTADLVRRAVLKLRVAQSLPWFGDMYAAGAHPNVTYELRRETGSGGWRVPNEYGVSQDRIWNGEIGAFEGVRFVENARTRVGTDGASSAKVARTYFFGREALAESVIVEPHIVLGAVIDKLQRFRPIGWYGDFDQTVYRQESLAIMYSGSAAL